MFIHMFICMSQRFNVQSIYYFSENLAKDTGRMYASGLLRVVKCLIIVNAECTAGKSPTNRYIGNSGPWLIVARPIDSCMIIPSHSHTSHIICQSFSHPKPLKHSWNLKLGRIIRVTEKNSERPTWEVPEGDTEKRPIPCFLQQKHIICKYVLLFTADCEICRNSCAKPV